MDKLPGVGQRIKIRLNEEQAHWYSTRIEDRTDTRISVSAPSFQGMLVPFAQGSKVQVRFEQPDALYSFVTTVIARRVGKNNSLRLYDLAIPREVTRFQRREMFRLPIILDVHFSVAVLPCKNETIALGTARRGCITDISGGGVRLAADIQLPVGSVVQLTFSKESLDLTVKGQIVNSHDRESEDGTEYKYIYGIKFCELDQRTQDKVVSFIFEEQRRRRRRELAVQ